MDFIIDDKAEFVGAMSALKGSVEQSRSQPLLDHVAITASNGAVNLRATNNFHEADATVSAQVATIGEGCVPSAGLAAAVRNMPDASPIRVKAHDGCLTISGGRSRYRLAMLPALEFPAPMDIDHGEAIAIVARDLESLLSSSSYATTVKDSRVFTSGIYIHSRDGKLSCVGSDGSRLGLRVSAVEMDRSTMAVVSADTARELERLLSSIDGQVDFVVGGHAVELRVPKFRFTAKTLNCEYPAYDRVIPTPGEPSILMPCRDLAAAVDRARAMMAATSMSAGIPIASISISSSGLVLSAGPSAAPVVQEEIVCEGSHDASFAINLDWAKEMLALWPKDAHVTIQSDGPGKPILFTSDDDPAQRHVIMPSIAHKN